MAISLESIKRGGTDRAPMIAIHGPPGLGKTTFAAHAPAPVFIRTEDGLGILDVPTFPQAESAQDVMDALAALYDEHEFQSVVIDSLSALEPLIWQQVAKDHGISNIEDIGFGKGYIYAMDYWRDIVAACRGLAERGITPILIAHSEVVKYDAPDTDAYDRHQIKLHKRAFQYLYEQSDIIGFAHEPVYVKKQDTMADKGKAKSFGKRELRLTDAPAIIAKNRYAMPESVELDWDTFAAHVPYFNQRGGK